MTNRAQFFSWMADGNVIKFDTGYSTQCHQWNNRVPTIQKLYKFFLREFIYI